MSNKRDNRILVHSISEITHVDVVYVDPEQRYWIRIEYIPKHNNYHLNRGSFSGRGMYEFETKGTKVRTWKTLKGVIRFIKLQASKDRAYYSYFLSDAEREELKTKKKKDNALYLKRYTKLMGDNELRYEKKEKALDSFVSTHIPNFPLEDQDRTSLTFIFDGYEFELVCVKEIEDL